jgi:hypothetical protein
VAEQLALRGWRIGYSQPAVNEAGDSLDFDHERLVRLRSIMTGAMAQASLRDL